MAVIAALSFTVLMGFAGLVLDVGNLYREKTNLQNTVDAVALTRLQ
ncbi:pilus assembly protein TadG-related protein [Sporomusa carbonis]